MKDALVAALGGSMAVGFVVFILFACIIFPVAFGALAGVVIEWLFPTMVAKLLVWTGTGMSAWELGAAAAFVGMLLRWMLRGIFSVTTRSD